MAGTSGLCLTGAKVGIDWQVLQAGFVQVGRQMAGLQLKSPERWQGPAGEADGIKAAAAAAAAAAASGG